MVSDLKFGPSSCKDSTYPASPSSVSNSCFFFVLFLLSPRHSQGRRNVSNFEGASYERTAYDRFIPLFLIRQNLGGSIEPWVPTPLPSSKYLARIFFRLSFFFLLLIIASTWTTTTTHIQLQMDPLKEIPIYATLRTKLELLDLSTFSFQNSL